MFSSLKIAGEFLPPTILCFSFYLFYFLTGRPEIIFVLLREKVNWRLKVARLLLLSADKGKIKSQIYPLKKKMLRG